MAHLLPHHRRHDPEIAQVPVPHGPATGAEHDEYPDAGTYSAEDEANIFTYLTHPDDSYTADGHTYWADLPFAARARFVHLVDSAESKKELKAVGAMVKRDPLAPVGWYFRHAVLPGAGLLLEGYVLFSIGNLEPLFKLAWPSCWGEQEGGECSRNWIASVTYLEVCFSLVGLDCEEWRC